MACSKGIELPTECWDVSSGAYEYNGYTDDDVFVAAANGEVTFNEKTLKILTVGNGIEISDEQGVTDTRIKVTIDEVPEYVIGNYIWLYVRPTADTKDLLSQKIQVVDNNAKRS